VGQEGCCTLFIFLTGNKQGTFHHENPVIHDQDVVLLALPNFYFGIELEKIIEDYS
jgi:hypothetical protein